MFYAGLIYGKVGAFSQLTNNGNEDKLEMDNTDIRFADQLHLDSLKNWTCPLLRNVHEIKSPTIHWDHHSTRPTILLLLNNKINGSHYPVFEDAGAIVDQTRPNCQYNTAELVYVPLGKSNSYLNPWLKLRTSLQHIGYSQANGTNTDAQFNNTFMANGWLAF